MPDNKDPNDMEIIDVIAFIKEKSAKFKENEMEKAEKAMKDAAIASYVSDSIDYVAPIYLGLYTTPGMRENYYEIAMSGERSLRKIANILSSYEGNTPFNDHNVVASLTTTVTISGGAFEAALDGTPDDWAVTATPPPPLPPILQKVDHRGTAKRLFNYDKALATVYESVWAELDGVNPDRYRAAMYMMRQTYDHLFGVLAPDDKVRASEYWTKKEAPKENQIFRRERIAYVANTKIRDGDKVDQVVDNTNLILDTYDLLSRAHKRKPIIPGNAQRAIEDMDRILVELLDAIEFE